MTEPKPMTLQAGSLGNVTTSQSFLGLEIKEHKKRELIDKLKKLGDEYHFLVHEWPGIDYFLIEIMRDSTKHDR